MARITKKDLEEQIGKLKEDNKHLSDKAESMYKTLGSKEADVSILKAQLEKVVKEQAEIAKERDAYATDLQNVRNQFNEKYTQLHNLKHDYEEMVKAYEENIQLLNLEINTKKELYDREIAELKRSAKRTHRTTCVVWLVMTVIAIIVALLIV